MPRVGTRIPVCAHAGVRANALESNAHGRIEGAELRSIVAMATAGRRDRFEFKKDIWPEMFWGVGA